MNSSYISTGIQTDESIYIPYVSQLLSRKSAALDSSTAVASNIAGTVTNIVSSATTILGAKGVTHTSLSSIGKTIPKHVTQSGLGSIGKFISKDVTQSGLGSIGKFTSKDVTQTIVSSVAEVIPKDVTQTIVSSAAEVIPKDVTQTIVSSVGEVIPKDVTQPDLNSVGKLIPKDVTQPDLGLVGEITSKNYLSTLTQNQISSISQITPSVNNLPGVSVIGTATTAINPVTTLLANHNIHLPEGFNITSFIKNLLQKYLSSNKQKYVTLSLIGIDFARSMMVVLVNLAQKYIPLNLDILWGLLNHLLGLLGFLVGNIFLLELICNIWVFRLRYFKNPLHIFDAIVVIVTFIFTLLPPDSLAGFGSLAIILRFWRIFQTIKTTVIDSVRVPLLQNSPV